MIYQLWDNESRLIGMVNTSKRVHGDLCPDFHPPIFNAAGSSQGRIARRNANFCCMAMELERYVLRCVSSK